ncbi:MAG: hypothetical protein R2724_32110 [Bryobacterales bacterium]
MQRRAYNEDHFAHPSRNHRPQDLPHHHQWTLDDHSYRHGSARVLRRSSGAADPALLVERSFEFLLEREPNTSILSQFDLSVIQRYFPEYERSIGTLL